MSDEDRFKEAPVQFELCRLIKNNMNEHHSISTRYESVKPEFALENKAVDLVIDAEIDNVIRHLLAVEIKKPTMRSYLLFERNSLEQIESYAKSLDSIYSILTDGYVLRLFGKDKHIGDYKFELNDDHAKCLLKELLELYDRKRQTLSFPSAPSVDEEEIIKERDGLVNALIEVLEQLGREKGFKLERRETGMSRMRYLTVGSFKKVFRMGIEREKRDISKDMSYVDLELSDLRSKLGMETLNELLVKLSQIPAFTCVDPTVAKRNDKYTWKKLKDIPSDGDPFFNSVKKQLLKWFFELSKRPGTPV